MPGFEFTSGPVKDEVQLVSFNVDRETFTVHVHQVRGIEKVEKTRKVSKMSSFIEGVMNLRSQITTIIDKRRRFAI